MAKSVDPNVYALSIQLSLESGDAFKTLDSFGEKISNIEQQLASSAKASLQSIKDVAVAATQAVVDLSTAFKGVDASTLRMQTTVVDTGKELTDQFDNGEDRLETAVDEFKQLTKTHDLHKDTGKELGKHLIVGDKFLKGLEAINKAIEVKNKGHEEQNRLLKTDDKLINQMNSSLGETNNSGKRIDREFRKVVSTASAIWGYIKRIDADTEKFVTTNYRAYGSQQQLVQSSRNLAMTNGVFYENAIEAYQVLGNLKVPREEMDKYAKTIAIANRTTGVGIPQIGAYVNNLRLAGINAAQAERNVAYITESMRKFGLNTRDVNALMSQSAASTKVAARIFGEGADGIGKWEQSRVTMAAFARQAGHGAEELASFEQWILSDVSAMSRFKDMTNTTEKGVDGYRLAMLRAGIETERQMAALQAANDGSAEAAAQLIVEEEVLIDVYYGKSRAAYEAARAMGRAAKTAGVTGESVADLDKIAGVAANTLENQLGEAGYTLTAELKTLGSTLWSVTGSVLQFAADAIAPFVHALNWVIRHVSMFIDKWVEFRTRLENTIPGFKYVTKIARFLVGIVIALVVGVALLSGGITAFSTAFSSASGIISGSAKFIASIGQTLVSLATAIGEVIFVILNSIGRGLAALGNQIKPVIVPLLGLALALLIISVAAYVFAAAVVLIANAGSSAIPVMFALVIAVIVLLTALVILAQFLKDPTTTAGLLVIAVVLLAVGVAAVLVGFGLKLAAQGIEILSQSLSFKLILMIFLLGVALISLGGMGLLAAPGIVLISIAMMALALAVYILGSSFNDILAAFTKFIGIAGDDLVTTSISFLVAGVAFFSAAMLMAAAAVGFMVAAPLLVIASFMVSNAAVLMIPAAGMLLIVGATLLIASLMILNASIVLAVATAILMASTLLLAVAALGLMSAASLLIVGGLLLVIASAFLAVGATLMIVGALLIIESSMVLMVAGGFLLGASLVMSLGLMLISGLAKDIFDVGIRIGIGGSMLYMGATKILAAADLLGSSALVIKMVSADLSAAGKWLIPASLAIYLGMKLLEWAISSFSKTVVDINSIAIAITLLTNAFQSLNNIPVGMLRDLAANSLAAIPNLDLLGDQLAVAAQKLDSGVTQFEGPANRLISILGGLSGAIAEFGAGLKLGDDIGQLAEKLDKYATLLENTSTRIETAVKSKAVPAMRAAEEAGVEEAIRSEAISTINVTYDDDTATSENDNQLMEIYNKQIVLLESLDERFATMQTGRDNVNEILTLLQVHLPRMAKNDQGLSSDFNSWQK